jgi:hypothetical protein
MSQLLKWLSILEMFFSLLIRMQIITFKCQSYWTFMRNSAGLNTSVKITKKWFSIFSKSMVLKTSIWDLATFAI